MEVRKCVEGSEWRVLPQGRNVLVLLLHFEGAK